MAMLSLLLDIATVVCIGLLVAACILWIAASAFTVRFMLPLNTRLARARPNSSPQDSLLGFRWLAARQRPRLVALIALHCFAFWLQGLSEAQGADPHPD